MNLAEKLANVDMTADNRISDVDRKYCETHQKAYESALENLKGFVFLCECADVEQDVILGDYDKESRSYSGYTTIEDFSLKNVNRAIRYAHERFIRYITNYFDRTYHIELDFGKIKDYLIPTRPKDDSFNLSANKKRVEEWEKQMESLHLNFEDILDQILIQLDGRTFVERALEEVIENCREFAWSNNTPFFEIKGDIIRFKDYFCDFTDWYSRGNWKMTSRMESIIPALYHYETGLFGDYPYSFSRLFNRFDYPELDFDNDNKLKTIKCFKNGRVDVKFTSKIAATEFADKYLGWIANGGIAA